MFTNEIAEITTQSLKEIPIQEQIGKEIRKWRRAKGWSQSDLADLSNTSQAAIAIMESGQGNPTFQTVDRVLHILNKRLHVRFMPALPQPYEPEPISALQD